MSKRDYSLDALRKLRESEESEAEARVAATLGALGEAQRTRAKMSERATKHDAMTKDRIADASSRVASGGEHAQLGHWQTRRKQELSRLHEELVLQDEHVAVADRAVAQARALLIEARTATKTVENHYEAWAASEKAKEEKQIDDEAADIAAARSTSKLP
jgi:flagellar biosynthesis chaperone FliJ